MNYFCAVKFGVKVTLLGLMCVCAGLSAQVRNQSMGVVLPLMKTNLSIQTVEQDFVQQGFILKGPRGSKVSTMYGMIDSNEVILTVRKTGKKGKVWAYELVYQNAAMDWVKKRAYMDALANNINGINKQNSSVLLKTLPQYCHGNEAQCFADGVAKYNYHWYWNSAVARTKTMDLQITMRFQMSITLTDNVMEAAMR